MTHNHAALTLWGGGFSLLPKYVGGLAGGPIRLGVHRHGHPRSLGGRVWGGGS